MILGNSLESMATDLKAEVIGEKLEVLVSPIFGAG